MDLAAAEQALYNPRSYLAKSVPQRMAIISAGVIMNVIFALICAIGAFRLGLFQVSCGVGAVVPGNPAWQMDLRPGDQIVKIAGEPVDRFQDLRAKISIGDIQNGVPLVIDRPGVEKPIEVIVQPSRGRMMPTIGVAPPLSDLLAMVRPGTTGYDARPELAAGDKVVAIDGRPISNYAQLNRQLTDDAGKSIQVIVERRPANEKDQAPSKDEPAERITVQVPPQPIKHLGLVMEMGPIGAIQDDSPAATAKLQPGDRLTRVAGEPVGDPMSLPDRLRKLAQEGKPVTIVVERKGQSEPVSLQVSLRKVNWHDPWYVSQKGAPALVSAPALGVAYEVPSRVEQVDPKSPAAEAGVRPGDVVVQAKLLYPKADEIQDEKLKELVEKIEPQLLPEYHFKEKKEEPTGWSGLFSSRKKEEIVGWPNFFFGLQQDLPGTKVQLLLEDGREVTMRSAAAAGWFNPDRGLQFDIKGFTAGGTTWAEAARLGYRETTDSLLLVFQFLRRLGTQISFKAIGGPVAILTFAYGSASQGAAELLIFLTMISANLAVLNFLPIPVLDGGHMAFLTYEGITGRLPNEKIHLALTWMGLIFILVLMAWALGLDFHIIPRQ